MTTERTPQDVLRELRESLLAELDWLNPMIQTPEAVEAVRVYRDMAKRSTALLIDKAIAEAPDSPPESGWLRYAIERADNPYGDGQKLEAAGFEAARRRFLAWEVPDTLSEKPGLDVERLAAILRNADVSMRDERGRNRSRTALYWRDLAVLTAGLIVGSTDSEGR